MSVEGDLAVLVHAPFAWFERWELFVWLGNRADNVVIAIGTPRSTSP